jgi:hypothetical protein
MSNTHRVFGNKRKLTLTFSGIAASAQLLADSNGNTRFPIGDINWQRIVMHSSLDSIAATSTTSITFALLTSAKTGGAGATTDLAAVKADGSTTFKTNHTATGVKSDATGKIASTGATAANVADFISILATPDASVTAAAGSVDIFLEGQ